MSFMCYSSQLTRKAALRNFLRGFSRCSKTGSTSKSSGKLHACAVLNQNRTRVRSKLFSMQFRDIVKGVRTGEKRFNGNFFHDFHASGISKIDAKNQQQMLNQTAKTRIILQVPLFSLPKSKYIVWPEPFLFIRIKRDNTPPVVSEDISGDYQGQLERKEDFGENKRCQLFSNGHPLSGKSIPDLSTAIECSRVRICCSRDCQICGKALRSPWSWIVKYVQKYFDGAIVSASDPEGSLSFQAPHSMSRRLCTMQVNAQLQHQDEIKPFVVLEKGLLPCGLRTCTPTKKSDPQD